MAETESQSQSNQKGGGKKKIIIICICIVVVAVVAGVILFGRGNDVEDDGKRDVISAPEDVEEVLDIPDVPDYIPQNYTVTQNSEWHFSANSGESTDAYVENSTDNETPVYIDLLVDETGEIVYSSPVLELGASMKGFVLDKPLEKGEYECTVVYHLVDDEQNELTTVNVGVNVVVED